MRKNHLIIFGLVVSVAANLFFVGGIAVQMLGQNDSQFRPFPPNIAWIVRDLSAQRRTELTPIIETNSEVIRPLRVAIFETQGRVNRLMSEQSLDVDAISQAFAEMRAANVRYQEVSHQQSVSLMAQLSESEREQALQFLDRRGPKDGVRRGFGSPRERMARRMRWGREGGFEPRSGFNPPPPPRN
jgi:uncharacterized membrane protein